MLIGMALNIMLYGIMITQVYIYSVSLRRDRLWMKLFVRVLKVIRFISTIAYQKFRFHCFLWRTQ